MLSRLSTCETPGTSRCLTRSLSQPGDPRVREACRIVRFVGGQLSIRKKGDCLAVADPRESEVAPRKLLDLDVI
jgi:hypothetical protein